MTEVRGGRNERFPVVTGARRQRRVCKRSDWISAASQIIEHPLRRAGTNTRNKMHQPKTGNTIARVLNETEQRQYILDVSGVEEFQTAKLDKRDVPTRQFDF